MKRLYRRLYRWLDSRQVRRAVCPLMLLVNVIMCAWTWAQGAGIVSPLYVLLGLHFAVQSAEAWKEPGS